MREFNDSDTALIFRNYSQEEYSKLDSIFNEVNSWSTDENIKKYILSDSTFSNQLNDYLITINTLFNGSSEPTSFLYYIFEEDMVSGVILISNSSSHNKSSSIQYLAVNPTLQGKGIATRTIRSITQNPEFFTNRQSQEILASIDRTNFVSRKVFLKNKFELVKKSQYSSLLTYSRILTSSPKTSTPTF